MVGFDPSELRDPFGKWTKGGSVVSRLASDASGPEMSHEEATARIKAVQPNKKIGLRGAQIAHIPSKGLRVRIKGETKHYDTPEDAARSVLAGEHVKPESGAAREAGLRRTLGRPAKGRESPTPQPPSPRPAPEPPSRIGRKLNVQNIDPKLTLYRTSRTDYKGQHVVELHHADYGHIADLFPSESRAAQMGRTRIATGYHVRQGYKWKLVHPTARRNAAAEYQNNKMGGSPAESGAGIVDKLDQAARNALKRHERLVQKPVQTPQVSRAADIQTVADARQISQFMEHPAFVPTGSQHQKLVAGLAASQRLGDNANSTHLSAAVLRSQKRMARSRAGTDYKSTDIMDLKVYAKRGDANAQAEIQRRFDNAHADWKDARNAVLNSRSIGGNPGARRRMERAEDQMRSFGGRPSRTTPGTWEIPPPPPEPGSDAAVWNEIQNIDQQLREMADETGAPLYSAMELGDTRKADIQDQLSRGYSQIVVKVPSGSEVQMSPEAAKALIGLRSIRVSSTPPPGAPNPLQRRIGVTDVRRAKRLRDYAGAGK